MILCSVTSSVIFITDVLLLRILRGDIVGTIIEDGSFDYKLVGSAEVIFEVSREGWGLMSYGGGQVKSSVWHELGGQCKDTLEGLEGIIFVLFDGKYEFHSSRNVLGIIQ